MGWVDQNRRYNVPVEGHEFLSLQVAHGQFVVGCAQRKFSPFRTNSSIRILGNDSLTEFQVGPVGLRVEVIYCSVAKVANHNGVLI